MNKNGHEAKQDVEVLPEFVAIGLEHPTVSSWRAVKPDALKVEPHTEIELPRAASAARDAEEGRTERAAVLAEVHTIEKIVDVELERHVVA